MSNGVQTILMWSLTPRPCVCASYYPNSLPVAKAVKLLLLVMHYRSTSS